MRWFKDARSRIQLTGTEGIVLTILVLLILSPFSCWRRDQDLRRTLTLWLSGNPHEIDLYQDALDEYERRRPDLRVVMTPIPASGNTFLSKVLPAMQAGTSGDVLLLHWSMISEIASKNALLPLDDQIEADQYDMEDLFEGSTMPYMFHENLYAMPFRGSTMVLFYNKDLFDAAGLVYPDDNWTRDDFLVAAKRLTIRDRGHLVVGCMPEESSSWIYSAGGLYASDDLSEFHLTDPRTLDGLQFYVDLVTRHRVASPELGQEFSEVNTFESGRLGMMISGPWKLETFAHIQKFRWGVALFPKGPDGRHTRYAGNGFGIWSGTEYPDEAWDLVKFLSSREVAKMLCAVPTDIPARRSIAYSSHFLKPEYSWDMKVFLRAMEPSHATLHTFPRSNLWMEVRRRFMGKVEEILIDDLELEPALTQFEEDIREYLGERIE